MSGLSGRRAFIERAPRVLNGHATDTKNPDTLEMYLRLTGQKTALAERLERLEDQAREHADEQA